MQDLPLAVPLGDYAPPHGFEEDQPVPMSRGCDGHGNAGPSAGGGCSGVAVGTGGRKGKTGTKFLDLVELDLFDVSRTWLTPPHPTQASAAAARDAAAAAKAAAAVKDAQDAAIAQATAKTVQAAEVKGTGGAATEGAGTKQDAANTAFTADPARAASTGTEALVAAPLVVYPAGWKEYTTPEGRKVAPFSAPSPSLSPALRAGSTSVYVLLTLYLSHANAHAVLSQR